MKGIILSALCLGVLLAAPAKAWNVPEAVLCLECRDPQSYPQDWRNYAFNLLREGDMSAAELNFFKMRNRVGDWVHIDMNITYIGVKIDLGPIEVVPLPERLVIQIVVILPNGDQFPYKMDPRAHPNGLPVGAQRERPTQSTGSRRDGNTNTGWISTTIWYTREGELECHFYSVRRGYATLRCSYR